MTLLKTLRLILSPCAPVDRVNFIQLELDPEVMRFLNNGAVDHDRIDFDDRAISHATRNRAERLDSATQCG